MSVSSDQMESMTKITGIIPKHLETKQCTSLFKGELLSQIKKCIEVNENENTIYQNLWDTIRAVLKGEFIGLTAYIRKEEKSKRQSEFHLKSRKRRTK